VSAERPNVPAVVEATALVTTSTLRSSVAVPVMIADAGERAARRFLEFFAASINNDNTRTAYYRAVCSFFGSVLIWTPRGRRVCYLTQNASRLQLGHNRL
jgi:hypothetical protein